METQTLRRVLSASALCLLVACAERPDGPAAGGGGAHASAEPSLTSKAVDVARIVCRSDGIEVVDPVVGAHRDGVHIVVENPAEAWGVELHPEPSPYGFAAEIELSNGTTPYTSAIAPGEATVACVPTSRTFYTDPGIPTAKLTIVDPDGLWVPWGLTCGSGEQFRTRIEAAPDEDPLTVVRRLPGVLPTDVVDRPKYPGSARYSPIESVVLRDGEVIARMFGPYTDGSWRLLINACPGTGIGPS
jgi:hypothetical protein